MSRARRAAAAAIAVAVAAQLSVAGLVLAHRLNTRPASLDVLRVAQPVAVPTPTAVVSRLRHVVRTVRKHVVTPPVPVPSVSLPVPLPSVSVPPLPVPRLPHCGDLAIASPPDAQHSYAVSRSGTDTGVLIVAGGSAYFPEVVRDGSFDTSVTSIDLSDGHESRTDSDPFFTLTDVADGSAWGADNDGAVRFDLSTGHIAQRWGGDQFPVTTADGTEAIKPAVVAVDGSSAYTFGTGGSVVAVSRIDTGSGHVAWTTSLPDAADLGGYSAGPRAEIGAVAGNVYVALPMPAHGGGAVLRVWRLDSSGKVVSERDISPAGARDNAPVHLVVTSQGVFASITTGGDIDATIFRLDPQTLAPLARTEVPVLEDLNAGPGGLWATSIQCNTFLWYQFSTDSLGLVGRPWSMPNQTYTVGLSGTGEVWSLRTRNPDEPVAVEGYRPGSS